MSWNGSGTFSRIYSWVSDKAAGLDISSSRMDTDSNDIASNGFGNCLTRDGQGFASANLPMGGFRHTGVQDGVARTDYASLGQLQDTLVNWAVAGGSADALTATYSPVVTAYKDGELFFVRAAHANATTTPTLNVNGVGAETITKFGGAALVAGDISGNLAECVFRYNIANTRFELLNPAVTTIPAGSITGSLIASATVTATNLATNVKQATISVIIDGGGSALTTGQKGFLEVPFNCTITRSTLLADQTGSVVVNVWKVAYGSFPPSSGNKITASAPPTISAAQNAQDSTLSGWTTSLSAGDILAFNVDSAATVQRVTLSLLVTKS